MAAVLRMRSAALHRSLPIGRLALVGVSSTAVARQEGFVARNEKLKRPISPHVSLLASNPDAVWMLSFAHRTTGTILSIGVSATALEYLYFATQGQGFSAVVSALQPLATQHPWLWADLKFLMAFPLTYHFFNGIRHLYWDTGRGFGLKFVYGAGYTVLAVSLCTAIGLAMYTTK